MQLIRCTKKLQKEMGLRKIDLTDDEPTFSRLGSWHANLILFDSDRCVIFLNDKTLFNFIVAGVSRAEIKDLSNMFIQNLYFMLTSEGFDQETTTKILREYDGLCYAATNSKSILGTMNELTFNYRDLIEEAGSVYSYLIPSIIQRLNRMPMKPINYNFPIDVLQSMYAYHH